MTLQVVWHGTPIESEALVTALTANCSCAYNDAGARTTCCSAHAMLNEQHTLDRLLFFRHTAYRLYAGEFVITHP